MAFVPPRHSTMTTPNKAAQELGRLGGLARSERKAAASRANGRKGGRGKQQVHDMVTGPLPVPLAKVQAVTNPYTVEQMQAKPVTPWPANAAFAKLGRIQP